MENQALRWAAEEQLRQRNAVLEGINRIFREVITGQTEEELGRICLEVAEEITQSGFGFIGEMSAEGQLSDIVISDPGWEACRIAAPQGHGTLPAGLEAHGLYGRALKEGRGFYTNDPLSEFDSIGTPEGHPHVRAFLGMPLIHAGKTIGMVGLGNREGGYRGEDMEAMEALAPTIVQVLLRKRAEEERDRLLQTVDEQRARLQAIIDSLPVGLLMADVSGRIVFANDVAHAIWGGRAPSSESVAEYREYKRYWPDTGKPMAGEELPMARALKGEVSVMQVIDFERLDGTRGTQLVSAAPIRTSDGTIIGSVGLVQDTTDRRQAEAERERLLAAEHRAREQAEAALRTRDEFLGVAAHELKTPITNLRGYAELTLMRIDAGRITDLGGVRPTLETINRHADRLAILTNQLLDLTGLESGELRLHRQETDLVPLVRDLAETMQAISARHTLTLHAPASLAARVDPERLRLVFYNLIDNAIKYSPKGGPVEVDLSAPTPQTVRIAVRDRGIGIPPEGRPQLFTRFHKAETQRAAGGLGLGLYIGRQLVALHGGCMWAEFPEDGGSRFVVNLPVKVPEKAQAEMALRR